MGWLIFASLTAVFASLRDLTSKGGLKGVDEYIVTWASRFFSLPLFLPLLFFNERPPLGDRFIPVLLITVGIQIAANLLYFRALKVSDLSLSIPLISFTPLFLLITSPLIVGEIPTLWDTAGIVLIVCGSYLLNLKDQQHGYFAPFKALVKEKGPKLMLIVALLWSILANLNKVGVQNSSPLFWAGIDSVTLAPTFLVIMLFKSQSNLKQITQNLKFLIPLGLSQGLTLLCVVKAVELTLVAHVVAVKRVSILLSAFAGHLLFKEPGIRERMMGAIIMFIGVTIVTLL